MYIGLLNLRGGDIANNPVFFAYILLTDTDIQLYIHEGRITSEIQQHFMDEGITVVEHKYEDISEGIAAYVIYFCFANSYTIVGILWNISS